jgi:hypothetical protein
MVKLIHFFLKIIKYIVYLIVILQVIISSLYEKHYDQSIILNKNWDKLVMKVDLWNLDSATYRFLLYDRYYNVLAEYVYEPNEYLHCVEYKIENDTINVFYSSETNEKDFIEIKKNTSLFKTKFTSVDNVNGYTLLGPFF